MDFFLLIKGADFLLKGARRFAEITKVPELVVGIVLVGIGTSLPEIILTIKSCLSGNTELILGNAVGIIDADYYNNPDNEGEIFFQMINLSPYDIQLHKGDIFIYYQGNRFDKNQRYFTYFG